MDKFEFIHKNKGADICGIYLLSSNNVVVYVGSSDYVPSRIYSHTLSEKVFDSVEVIECDRVEKASLEASTIIKHNPKYNFELPSTGEYTTVNFCLSQSKIELNELIKDIPVEFMRGGKRYVKTSNYNRLIKVMVTFCKDELKIMNDELIMNLHKKATK